MFLTHMPGRLGAAFLSVALAVSTVGLAVAAPAHQTAQQLRIDPTAFGSAAVTSDNDTAVTAPEADQLLMAGNHSTTYESLGFQTGYAELGSATSPSVVVEYLGSVYGTTTQAANAMQDGVTHTTTIFPSATKTDCTAALTVPCTEITFGATLTNNSGQQQTVTVLYMVVQVNECTAEVAAYATSDVAGTNGLVLSQYADKLDTPIVTTLKAACSGAPAPTPTGPASLSVGKLKLFHAVSGALAPTKSLKSKEAGYFVVVFKAQNGGTDIPSATVTFSKNGHTVRTDTMQIQTATDGSGTTGFVDVTSFVMKSGTAHFVATFNATLGTVHETATLKFTVKGKKKT